MKKRHLLIVSLLLLASVMSYGQGKRDKIRSLKVAFITEALALTPAEAEKFWPLYNAFEDRQFDIRKQKLRNLRERFDANPESLTDKEALALLTDMDETEEQLHETRKKFSQSLKGVLSPVKILKLRKAEDDFNRRLLRQYRNKD
ncbi:MULTISPECIES: sensor of ECF-type sigma factor [unclassified Flavobacterium]|uniref:sensor of ECF-type sigma factor n=1 Tax=unclassified Flavobacterium TaxID=196869 RepID=UPI001F12C706|nr:MULTISPECIES: sensor of ECF-type sigma factor [unclassified Flavobacterium]UMY64796.1 sensor of ECF-type sigma factor [Flavobacterium sp. HJ-32-4]